MKEVEPSIEVQKFSEKVYGNIDNDRYGFDPLLMVAIANIIMNLIKAINIIYFSSSPKFIKKAMEKRGLMMRILMRREARKAMKDNDDADLDVVTQSISDVVRDYGDDEFKSLVSSIR